MTSNQSHKAVVFGSISIDKIVNKHGSFSSILGGSAAYALLANKKNTCELVGVVGDDFQKNHFNLLSEHSITTNSLTQLDGNTFCWGGKYKDDFSSRKTLYVDPGVSESYIPDLSRHSKNCPFLLLGNTAPHLQKQLLNQMKTKPFVLLDTFKLYIDTANKELKELVKRVDLFCINFNEARAISGMDGSDLRSMSEAILELGPNSLIIKDGEHGSHYFDSKNHHSIKAVPVNEVIDTTGAGDAYIGGILMGMMEGLDILESMKYGAVTASFCIEGIGINGLIDFSKTEFDNRLQWIHQSNHTS